MNKPYDIKNDPRFLARIKKIESKANIKVIKNPVEIKISTKHTAYIAAIGINGSYLAIFPGVTKDGVHVMPPYMFSMWWTEKRSTVFDQTDIAKFMSMWVITSDDSDFEDVPHRNFDHLATAFKTLINCCGKDYFDIGRSEIEVLDQGIARKINNPYYKA